MTKEKSENFSSVINNEIMWHKNEVNSQAARATSWKEGFIAGLFHFANLYEVWLNSDKEKDE